MPPDPLLILPQIRLDIHEGRGDLVLVSWESALATARTMDPPAPCLATWLLEVSRVQKAAGMRKEAFQSVREALGLVERELYALGLPQSTTVFDSPSRCVQWISFHVMFRKRSVVSHLTGVLFRSTSLKCSCSPA
jgi:hypothetical protein